MWIVAIILINCITTIEMNNRLYSTKPKLFENNTIVCAPVNVSLLKAIVIYPTSDNVIGTSCEHVGIRCSNQICINQAICSINNQSCLCRLGAQGRDCSVKCSESYIQPNISTDRIVNGEIAVKNSWPYIVYIQIGAQDWCGGSLIYAWSVLTAAHCTYGRDTREFTLWLGIHKLDERENEMNQGIVEKRSVRHIFNHLDYRIRSFKTYQHGLTILRLSRSVQETAFIRYLCIVSDVQLNDQIDDMRLFQSKFMICARSNDFKTDSCQ
ncbi:unnamed protein product [Adineta ricciae]|uniref:Uncharacterized protein n=1 Tax=Adineta ricciae TaxID=249248 RepID=A0A814SXZ3_ADIRI|nr:unnamed protein product [Adineta ricciae]CAF1151908.1 unnamed protein product [Adineta ricciae]